MIALRSLVFYLGWIVITFFGSLAVMFSYFFPYRQRFIAAYYWGVLSAWWLRLTCGIRYEISGKENLPNFPVIIMSNHQSAWETIVFLHIFPLQTWVLKRELLNIPIYGWALSCLRPIAIDRKNIRRSFKQIITQGKERLQSGQTVIIFPEGTRVAPGEKRRYTISGALLAVESGYPVLLVAHNSGTFWQRGLNKQPGTIQIEIGPTIEPQGKTAEEINKLAQSWIEARLATMPSKVGQ